MSFYCAVNVRLKNRLSIENFYFLKINRSNRILLGKNGFDLFLDWVFGWCGDNTDHRLKYLLITIFICIVFLI